MVALKYLGTPPVPTVHFDAARIDDIPAVTEFVEAELEKLDCPMKTVVQVSIAIDEICSNIVKYAYPEKPGPITVKFLAKDDPRRVYVSFEDEGIPYNPLTKEDPDTTLSAEERAIGGLGIYMVKQTMDDVKYKYENGHNILTIQKVI
ncbi:MAG: ATP-binding protein [Eubacteriales bacterium]|nr:ATP-binding protein [Eubacteriales bacterium]